MQVKKIMQKYIVAVNPETDFEDIMRIYAKEAPVEMYVVDEDGKLQGIISPFDVLKHMVPEFLDSNLAKAVKDDKKIILDQFARIKDKKAEDIMVKEFVHVKPHHHGLEAYTIIVEQRVHVVPVLDNEGRIQGRIGRRDILKYLARQCDLVDDGVLPG